jgi:lysyl-tRNA synthetase, class II
MADFASSNTPGTAATEQVVAAVEKLHLDEMTGEMVSKTELKKRQKARDKDAKKKEKLVSKGGEVAPAPAKRENAEADEKELTPNQVRNADTEMKMKP